MGIQQVGCYTLWQNSVTVRVIIRPHHRVTVTWFETHAETEVYLRLAYSAVHFDISIRAALELLRYKGMP